jgi:hypothetical protein
MKKDSPIASLKINEWAVTGMSSGRKLSILNDLVLKSFEVGEWVAQKRSISMLNCSELVDRMSSKAVSFPTERSRVNRPFIGRWFRCMKQSDLHILDLSKSGEDTRFTKEHFFPMIIRSVFI